MMKWCADEPKHWQDQKDLFLGFVLRLQPRL